MKNQSTRKEWEYVQTSQDKSICHVYPKGDVSAWSDICVVFGINGEKEAQENAKLIAAAPDMLAAIQSALRIADLWHPRNAIYADEHEAEMQALNKMKESFLSAIKKATE